MSHVTVFCGLEEDGKSVTCNGFLSLGEKAKSVKCNGLRGVGEKGEKGVTCDGLRASWLWESRLPMPVTACAVPICHAVHSHAQWVHRSCRVLLAGRSSLV